jgi:hypothetical protein
MTRIIVLSTLVFSLSFYHCTANDPGKVNINVIQLTDTSLYPAKRTASGFCRGSD